VLHFHSLHQPLSMTNNITQAHTGTPQNIALITW
jgi:hypothetical protein